VGADVLTDEAHDLLGVEGAPWRLMYRIQVRWPKLFRVRQRTCEGIASDNSCWMRLLNATASVEVPAGISAAACLRVKVLPVPARAISMSPWALGSLTLARTASMKSVCCGVRFGMVLAYSS
jgi:hypothetical protein